MSRHTGRPRRFPAALLALAATLTAGCSGAAHGGAPVVTPTTAPEAAPTVWLCRPGLAEDPCSQSRDATVVHADGTRSRETVQTLALPTADCFYVYPTVSLEPAANADLTVQPAETSAAVSQASRFSQVCRVWAPMYRQVTVAGLLAGAGGDPKDLDVAYRSLLSGWRDYLAHDNEGRRIVLIGHSQGASMLMRLLREEVDPSPTLRARVLSAILLGGNVDVPTGADVGGSFQHLPACRARGQIGCVIAYSSFPSPPPRSAFFGRPGQGVSLLSGQTSNAGQVLCVNPADLAGGTEALQPYFPTSTQPPFEPPVDTPWVTYPDLYTATCRSAQGATWLQVDDVGTAADKRPRLTEVLGPDWGYHPDDVNLALGNLVTDVAGQEASYQATHG